MVKHAADGMTALASITAGGIDLVLLDLMLPGMDGLEVCRRVRTQESEVYLPIIMLTGLAAPDQRHLGIIAGAYGYVGNPFTLVELLDRVQAWARTRERLVVAHERQRLAAERAEHARLEGVRLAVRTLKDRINNQLARTVSAAEMITLDPDVPLHLRELGSATLEGAREAASTVQQLDRITTIHETEWGPGLGSTLDLTRSTKQSRSAR